MKYYLAAFRTPNISCYYVITDTNQCTKSLHSLKNIENQFLDGIWADPEDLVEGKVTPDALKAIPDLTLLATFDQHPTIEFIRTNCPEILL